MTRERFKELYLQAIVYRGTGKCLNVTPAEWDEMTHQKPAPACMTRDKYGLSYFYGVPVAVETGGRWRR